MKKRCISLLLTMLLLVSCNGTPQTDKDGSIPYNGDCPVPYNTIGSGDRLQSMGGYIYFERALDKQKEGRIMVTSPGGARTLMRYNCETGNITAVCPDPLCSHLNEDCPLLGVMLGNWNVRPDGKIQYWRWLQISDDKSTPMNEYERIMQKCLYTPADGKMTVLESYDNGGLIGPELYTENGYFWEGQFYDEETDSYSYAVMYRDYREDEPVSVTEKSEAFTGIGFTLGGRLYLSDAESLYSVAVDGGDRKEHIFSPVAGRMKTNGTHVYYVNDGELCRRALENGEEERLGIPVLSETYGYLITKNYIYYEIGEKVTLGKADIPGYAAQEVTLLGGELRRCRHDGSEDELVFLFDGDLASCRLHNWTVCGDAVYGYIGGWKDSDGDGVFVAGDQFRESAVTRISVPTGELTKIGE
ncbi:MAG: hypothetical protein IJC71_03245 [Clostridia bacterium]|nr:hypothetical protein [Clostridia bacterium]